MIVRVDPRTVRVTFRDAEFVGYTDATFPDLAEEDMPSPNVMRASGTGTITMTLLHAGNFWTFTRRWRRRERRKQHMKLRRKRGRR